MSATPITDGARRRVQEIVMTRDLEAPTTWAACIDALFGALFELEKRMATNGRMWDE